MNIYNYVLHTIDFLIYFHVLLLGVYINIDIDCFWIATGAEALPGLALSLATAVLECRAMGLDTFAWVPRLATEILEYRTMGLGT